MTPVYVMLAVGAVLMVYQIYFRKNDDDLDNRGRPKRK